MARTRTRRYGGVEGFYQQRAAANIYLARTSGHFAQSTITDQDGVRDGPLEINHSIVEGHILNTRYYLNPEKTQYREAVNFELRYFGSPTLLPAHLALTGRPSNSTLAVSLLKATSPSKPVVDIPVSLLELRELPSLVRNAGNSIIKRYANDTLRREFGFVPLYKDLLALMAFTEDVEKRVLLFKKFREKPLLRKATLWQGTSQSSPDNLVTSNSSPASGWFEHRRISVITKSKVWGYVKWTPPSDFGFNPDYSDERLNFLARQAVLGSKVGIVTLWNAVPWTWLIDWFGNIGDWLEANRQVIPFQASTPRICETKTTEELFVGEGNAFGLPKGSMPVIRRRVTKTRALASGLLPSAELPLLTGRQVNILASLAVLRLL